MKILLVGEYSRLHNSLKEGLTALGHDVTIIGSGDYFKNYPVDIKLNRTYTSGLAKKWKVLLYRLFGIDLTAEAIKKQFFSHSEALKGYDVVQLINESPLGATPKIEKEVVSFLSKHNKKLFVLSCGADYLSVKYAYEKKFRYSILSPLFNGKVSEKDFGPILKYLQPAYKSLHEFVFRHISGVIATDMDYHIPMKGHPLYLGLIANPINIEKLPYLPVSITDKIIIFHGINRGNYYKKGSDYFEEALFMLTQKYADKVEIITVESVPYAEYIELYNRAHIVLDQVLGMDQGYNALEAMAKGKVVFTGAEKEFVDYYNLEKPVAINALPDAQAIFADLEQLVLNPSKITEISKNAREFIEREHNYVKVAERYVQTWQTVNA
ncbi:glycosyltransferase [Marixanthomonas spongiae]|uniref:Glycosyl transferase family 1 n=1 Tax=Marixanthomonas spongiae TaxID=2174845 RepID=A0A2U0I5A4_9FLAO|nr:glycosyltransferase [Marixanthomonas spongiae]PVW16288.1 glycosyl transferase family 1 [Marixanthomonas spongiae]